MHAEPPSMAIDQPLTPFALERVVRTCLAKDPDSRWQSAADLARELKSIGQSPIESAAQHSQQKRLSAANIAVPLLAMIAVAGASAFVGYRLHTVTPARMVQFSIAPPSEGLFAPNPGGLAPAISVSPDGRWLVYSAAIPPTNTQLWLRAVDSLEARPLQGTEGARYPFWSPDSHSLAFFTQVDLKRTDIAGGAPRQIAGVEDGAGGTWNKRGRIVFGTVSHGLFAVSDEGGAVAPLHPTGDSGVGRMPVFLPDDQYFVYWDRRGQNSDGDIRLASFDGKDGTALVSSVRGVGLFGGYLFFARGETLFAQPFDVTNRRISGPATAIADGIAVSNSGGYASFAGSDTGLLLLGRTTPSTRQARWIDRKGTRLKSVAGATTQTSIRLSADGHQLLSARPDPSTTFNNLWTYDIELGTESRVTAGGQPIFSPDGKWIAYIQMPSMRGVARIRSDGTGDAETILDRLAWPSDWSRDGRRILAYYPAAGTGIDMGVIDVETHQLTPLIQAAGDQGSGRFSPDQQSIAYASTDTGRLEVFVRSLTTGEQRHVSNGDGGSEPRWRSDGKELFYLGNDRNLMAVKIDNANGHLTAGVPTPLFQVNVGPPPGLFGVSYEPSGDGQRFLVNELTGPFSTASLSVIVNWPELLKSGR